MSNRSYENFKLCLDKLTLDVENNLLTESEVVEREKELWSLQPYDMDITLSYYPRLKKEKFPDLVKREKEEFAKSELGQAWERIFSKK